MSEQNLRRAFEALGDNEDFRREAAQALSDLALNAGFRTTPAEVEDLLQALADNDYDELGL